jgi:hypothetical protein
VVHSFIRDDEGHQKNWMLIVKDSEFWKVPSAAVLISGPHDERRSYLRRQVLSGCVRKTVTVPITNIIYVIEIFLILQCRKKEDYIS